MVKGKLALVTGGGGGIGQTTCITLAEQGARVVVTDLNASAAEATFKLLPGSEHCFLQLDVTKPESVERVFNSVQDKYKKPPSIVINCAGILLCVPFLEETLDTIQRQIDVNFKGTLFVTQTACKEMKAAEVKGSIVNIASIASRGVPWLVSYSASKAAVVAMTRAIAKELGDTGIRLNAVCPGPIDTPLLDPIPQWQNDIYISMCPAKRFGQTQEVADLLVFLASEKSSYINGTAIDITGGV